MSFIKQQISTTVVAVTRKIAVNVIAISCTVTTKRADAEQHFHMMNKVNEFRHTRKTLNSNICGNYIENNYEQHVL